MMLIIQYNDLNIPARIMYNFNEKILSENLLLSLITKEVYKFISPFNLCSETFLISCVVTFSYAALNTLP